MKKLLTLFFSLALVFTFSANAAFANGDKNCDDFSTWEEAQKYFESKGGSKTNNVDGLDRDHDGLACETLKGFDPSHKNPNDNKDDDNGNNGNNDNNGGSDNNNNNNSGNNGGSDNNNNNSGNNNSGGTMPKTATSYPTLVLMGALLLIAGLFTLKARKNFS